MKKIVIFILTCIIFIFAINPAIIAEAYFPVDFDLACEAVYLVDMESGLPIYEQNADEIREPASTTKIMTCILAIENIPNPEDTIITVSEHLFSKIGGSSAAGLKDGEKLSAYDLFYALMIPSGNDAAMVLADYVGGGSWTKFVEMMNEKAKELGCENTNFVNPHGLHVADHVTTARDMYIIANYAWKNEFFQEVCSEARHELLKTNKQEKRMLYTTNLLITQIQMTSTNYYYRYAKGIKTGSATESGYCVVSTAIKGNESYMCIAMGAPYRDENGVKIETNGAFLDTRSLYEWAFNKLELVDLLIEEEAVTQIAVNYGWGKDSVLLMPTDSFTATMPKGVESESVQKKLNIPSSINAPVKKGDVIGSVTLVYANEDLGTIDLIAGSDVTRNNISYLWAQLLRLFQSKWFWLSLLVLAFLTFIAIRIIKKQQRINSRKLNKRRF